MGNLTYVFERVERKFLLTPSQYEGLMRVLPEYMQADQYGESTILSLYLDTADSLLIRRSLEKPVYKEKLRLRSYGVPGDGDNVFLEMKKKVQGVVYKRRICLPPDRAMACLAQESIPAAGGQIGREIAYMLRRYRLRPAVLLAYDRTAYTELEPSPNQLRITIDRDIRSRQTDLDLRLGGGGRIAARARHASDGNQDRARHPAVAVRCAGSKRDPSHIVFQIRPRVRGPHARGAGPRHAPRRCERRCLRCCLPCLTSIRACPSAACWC